MKELTVADIQAVDDRPTLPVEVPEWNGVVYVRTLSVNERELLESGIQPDKNGRVNTRGFRVSVVVASAVDADGKPLFDVSAKRWLGEKSASAVERIATAALDYNGMSESSRESAEGKSEGEPASASFTDSPSASECPSPTSADSSTLAS